MKYLSIFVIIIIFANKVFSQSGWIQLNSGETSELNCVRFVNSNIGWCAGNNGLVLKTTNSGLNWFPQNSSTNLNLISIYFTSNTTGYIAGDTGTIIKTTNGGDSWIRSNLASTNNLTSINFVNDSTGFSGGSSYDDVTERKYYYKTTNYGNSWDSIHPQNSSLISLIHFNSLEFGWFVNLSVALSGAILYKTTNNGSDWVFSFFNNMGIYSVLFIDTLNGWMSSKNSFSINTIYRTNDGGVTWITQSPGTGTLINSLYFTDKRNGWGAGDNSRIQSTTNGGVNWIDQTSFQPGINYNSVYFTDSLTGWVVGDSGVILKTTTGGVLTGFSNTSTEIPDKFSLSQNYPNPFNPNTIINFQCSMFNFISLRVFDVLGNEVATLVNENKQPGSYQIEFDGSNYPSGVYLYRLEINGSIIDTKRMILLK
ncbi:MAG: T9SS type A sorting domain-containing protein [Ignavibacteriae bacterium]|nr:T9SS type A sorting domain-containing protein [Ignavibacteriota bacterium]